MAEMGYILGQLAPAATTEDTLYTVPTGKQTLITTGKVCNRSATPTSFRVAIIPAGETIDDEHYIYYDLDISGNDTFSFTEGLTLTEGDTIVVYATDATLSFSVFGFERDIASVSS